jgi:NAD(P)-dependent dehydrogenase (short-subunit alcohol dehydrogenase family)
MSSRSGRTFTPALQPTLPGRSRVLRAAPSVEDHQKGQKIMTQSLENQTVVVIGGSGGIGAAVVVRAREAGATVLSISRSGKGPDGVQSIAADVSDPEELNAALGSIGAIDHLVYTAAARVPSGPLGGIQDGALQQALDTKLQGAVNAIRLALPSLSERASVTLTSGQVSRKYGTGTLVKGIVNAAVDAAGRHLAKELAPRRVNVISPGVVDTELWGSAGSETRSAVLQKAAALPVGRVGCPSEVADAYIFAMTNGFLTGTVIDIDGGGLL